MISFLIEGLEHSSEHEDRFIWIGASIHSRLMVACYFV
jgi:hypothetical protein